MRSTDFVNHLYELQIEFDSTQSYCLQYRRALFLALRLCHRDLAFTAKFEYFIRTDFLFLFFVI